MVQPLVWDWTALKMITFPEDVLRVDNVKIKPNQKILLAIPP